MLTSSRTGRGGQHAREALNAPALSLKRWASPLGARDQARREGVELVIHRRDGSIRDSDSYGNDPFSARDQVRSPSARCYRTWGGHGCPGSRPFDVPSPKKAIATLMCASPVSTR